MLSLVITILCWTPLSLAVTPVPQGFPANWNGDQYNHVPSQIIQPPPSWLNGYLFCQLSASYGSQSNPRGQKLTHMFDAISGMGVFDISPGRSTFTGSYYPTKAYKIWDFYARDFTKSSVAWDTFFSTVNVTALNMWSSRYTDYGTYPPNVDFWKVGKSMIAGTEYYGVGLTFDIPSMNNFRPYPFKESSPIMQSRPLVPVEMPIHERIDPATGLMWATVSALNVSVHPPNFHQVIFTVDNHGVRTVQGIFHFVAYDVTKCSPTGSYLGDKRVLLPRYIHSITSTDNYIILPLGSSVINPCLVVRGPSHKYPPNATLFDPINNWYFQFAPEATMMFLIFDKRFKRFLAPIDTRIPQSTTHQLNAYETSPGRIIADMITYDKDAYNDLYVDQLTRRTQPVATGHLLRFTLDLNKGTVTSRSILPQNPTNVEFPQFNHAYEGKRYKYGYVVTFPYYAGNQILKINVDDPSGKSNLAFQPAGQSISLAEPYFVQNPRSTAEDDGVLILRALDTAMNKTRVYVLDAKRLTKVGEVLANVVTPFGFHERFYTKQSLGL